MLESDSKKLEENKIFIFLKHLMLQIREDNVTAIGAQLSYYLFLSIFPFLIFFLNILSFTPLAREDVLKSLVSVLPIDAQNMIISLVMETVANSSETLLSLSALTGIWAASKGLLALIRAINNAYNVKEKRSYIQLRLLAVVFTLALLILLTIVLLTLVFGGVIGEQIVSYLGLTLNFMIFWQYFRIIVSIVSMILIFALLFRFSPSIKNNGDSINFKNSLPGAAFTSIGWIITSTLFSYYVNNFSNYAKTYGSLGGIIVLLLWLYMSSIIIVIGGEINATLKHMKNKA